MTAVPGELRCFVGCCRTAHHQDMAGLGSTRSLQPPPPLLPPLPKRPTVCTPRWTSQEVHPGPFPPDRPLFPENKQKSSGVVAQWLARRIPVPKAACSTRANLMNIFARRLSVCFVRGGNKCVIQAAFLPHATWECVQHAKVPSCPSFILEPRCPAGLGDSRVGWCFVSWPSDSVFILPRASVLPRTRLPSFS